MEEKTTERQLTKSQESGMAPAVRLGCRPLTLYPPSHSTCVLDLSRIVANHPPLVALPTRRLPVRGR